MLLYRLAIALVGAMVVLGCESLHVPLTETNPSPTPPRNGEGLSAPPSLLGKGDEGLGSSDPDPLALAAECLERGDKANAVMHLETYVRLHPEQILFRIQLADLLQRAGRDDAAKAHYERFAADAQTATGPVRNHLVTAHTRLMEIAQHEEDRFAEVFHRGVGLLLLVREHEKAADRDAAFCEEMLCQSLKALNEAKELRPDDPRARVYLAEVYDRTGNHRAADAERAAARGALVPGQLTLVERKAVILPGDQARRVAAD